MKKLLLACAALTLATTACFVDPPTTPPTGGNWATCPTAAVGQVQVAIVTEGVPNPAHEVVCVVVPDGSSSIQALQARAARLGTEAPRLAFGGSFVCSIDGNPVAPECGELPGDATGWRSWNYSNGGTQWTGSQIGAASHSVHQGDVDGWNFGTWNYSTTFPGNPTHSPSFSVLTGS